MAYDPKRVVVFGAAGLLISALLITAFQFMPSSVFSDMPLIPDVPIVEAAKGLLIVKVKDAPKELEELNILIDGVRVHRAIDDAEDTDGESSWMEVTVMEDEPFNLLELTDFALVLAADELPIGKYTEIRLHVVEAVAVIGGEDVPLSVVANGWLKVKVHFTLDEEVTTLVLDIDVNENSIANSKKLNPVVKTAVEKGERRGWLKPVQTHFMWGDDDETPDWGVEDELITDVAIDEEALRLRLSILNDGKATWSGVQLKLQYATDTEGDWYDVDEEDQSGIWRYDDGEEDDKTLVDDLLLTGSTVEEHFVESSPTETIVSVPVDDQGEWDICIESNGATEGETYYFRFVLSDGTPLYDYSVYPTLTTANGG